MYKGGNSKNLKIEILAHLWNKCLDPSYVYCTIVFYFGAMPFKPKISKLSILNFQGQ